MVMKIDLNCDMGESFGVYTLGQDELILPYITSANIACGFHAGDPQVMARTVHLAAQAGVAIGAHVSYPDLVGFGRRDMNLSVDELESAVLYQLGALAAFTKSEGVELVHVKPHGALYNRAAVDEQYAAAIARAVSRFSRSLILVGLAGSKLVEIGRSQGLVTVNEGFPDRAYLPNGQLMPRNQDRAVLSDPQKVSDNALALALHGIEARINEKVDHITIDTLCLHGDNHSAVENARQVRQKLLDNGFSLASLVKN